MSNQSIGISEDLHRYVVDHGVREPTLARENRLETADHPWVRMQIAPEQGAFMGWLVSTLGAKRCLEIGVFTGYSSIWMLSAMGPAGRLVACDIEPAYTSVAERYWERMGVRDQVDLRLAPAQETLDALLADGQAGQFDFAFIDADKENYADYYEKTLKLLRPSGVILVDNVLWSGSVLDPQDVDSRAIAAFNTERFNDPRVDLSMIPIADGITLLRKL